MHFIEDDDLLGLDVDHHGSPSITASRMRSSRPRKIFAMSGGFARWVSSGEGWKLRGLVTLPRIFTAVSAEKAP